MAAQYFRISPKLWRKARMRGWTDSETNLAIYLLTCTHRKLEGLYVLPKPYIASDRAWDLEKVEENLAVLLRDGFAEYDEAAEVVLIPKALKFQSPSTEMQIRGAIAQLRALPRTSLWDRFRVACECHCPKLAAAVEVEWPSHSNATSHAHASAPGESSSSSSISNSNPPQPPAERGEQDQEASAQGQEQPRNSRAHGTNPRALAQTARAADAERAATSAAAALSPQMDEHTEAWERVRAQMKRAVSESTWSIWLATIHLVGVSEGALVVDAPDETRAWVAGRFERLVKHCADAEGAQLRLATGDEHRGLARSEVAA